MAGSSTKFAFWSQFSLFFPAPARLTAAFQMQSISTIFLFVLLQDFSVLVFIGYAAVGWLFGWLTGRLAGKMELGENICAGNVFLMKPLTNQPVSYPKTFHQTHLLERTFLGRQLVVVRSSEFLALVLLLFALPLNFRFLWGFAVCCRLLFPFQ